MIDPEKIVFDDEEREIEDNLETYIPLSREESNALIDRAPAKRQLSLRLYEKDVEAVKKLADRDGSSVPDPHFQRAS